MPVRNLGSIRRYDYGAARNTKGDLGSDVQIATYCGWFVQVVFACWPIEHKGSRQVMQVTYMLWDFFPPQF